jgi:hypothetical protein
MPIENDELEFDEVVEQPQSESNADAPVSDTRTLVSANEDAGESSEDEVLAQLNQIEALADIDPSVREMEEYKNLKSIVEKNRDTAKETEDEVEEEETEDEVEEEEAEERDSTNPFGVGVDSEDEEMEEVEFEIDEEMEDYIKDHYGLEDVSTFFEKVDTWRNQSQSGAENSKQLEELNEGLQNLPSEIKSAIQAFANAEDYKSAFNSASSKVNYDDDFKNQDKEGIVSHYFKEEIAEIKESLDDGDIDDDDYEDKVELLYKSARKLFESDKKMVVNRRAEIMREQEDSEKNFKGSVVSSVEKLKQQFPNFSKKDLQKVRQRLVDEDIESLFYNKDGTYKEEAAEMMAFSMFGKQVMESLLGRAKKDGISKANETIVKRGNKKPRQGQTQRKQSTEALDSISHLQGQFSKDPYS